MNSLKSHSLPFLLLIALLANNLFAQNWKQGFEKDVNLIKMTEASIAIVGTDDALYGIDKSGKVRWQNQKLRKVEANRVEVLGGSELIFVSDKGMLSRNRVINVLTGAEYADTGVKMENVFGATIVHPMNMLLVMPDPKNIDAWDIESNQKLWTMEGTPDKISTLQSAALTATFQGMQPITYTSQTSGIMHLGKGHLAHYNFETGQPTWMFDFKPYKMKEVPPSNPAGGFAVMKLDPATNTLYFPFSNILIAVDATTGQSKWDPKAHKLTRVRDIYITDEGVLVLTPNGVTLLNPSNGEEIFDKPIKLKGADESLLIRDGEDFYAVSKKSLVKLDLKTQKAEILTEKIKFDGNESFSQLEVYGDLIALTGSQNAIGVNKRTGEIMYQHFYKAPGASIGAIAQNMALAAVALAATANSQRIGQQNADAFGRSSYFQYTPAVIKSGGANTTQSRYNMYISTKFKSSDANGFGLAKVNKQTGALEDKIVIGDRDPVYAADELEGLIYYKSGKREIACRPIHQGQ